MPIGSCRAISGCCASRKQVLSKYFKALYRDAMRRAYEAAYGHIARCSGPEAAILDCGANNGWAFDVLAERFGITRAQYHGIEWNARCAEQGRARGLDIAQGDLNQGIACDDGSFSCIQALSVLEHLLNPCRFLKACHRVLRPGGRLVLLTPNSST